MRKCVKQMGSLSMFICGLVFGAGSNGRSE